jgi:hypothetical protein
VSKRKPDARAQKCERNQELAERRAIEAERRRQPERRAA